MKSTLLRIYSQCNFQCRTCMAADYNMDTNSPPLDSLKKQILQAKEDNIEELDIGGGEPTMYPHLIELLDLAYQNKIRCAICSNGFKFSNIDYVKKFSKFQPIGIKISFHSHREKVFDFITQVKGSYRAILKAIENIGKQLDLYPIFKDSYLLANIVVHRYNFQDLPHIVRFLHTQGVYVVKISQLVLSGNVYFNPDLLISPAELQPYLTKAIKYLKDNRLFYYIDKFPICILESEYEHFIPSNDSVTYVKLRQCLQCQHNQRCCGISKVSLIARYRRTLIEYNKLSPKDFFKNFFTTRDIDLIKRL